jgi:hypothetical protein
MADDKVEGRELTWRGLLPWTELFRGFQIALDLNKLLLAAAGIVVMAFGWWLLSLIFGAGYGPQPIWPGNYESRSPDPTRNFQEFKHDRNQWNLMHVAADAGKVTPEELPLRYEVADLAASLDEYKFLTENKVKTSADYDALVEKMKNEHKPDWQLYQERVPLYARLYKEKPAPGQFSTWPWSENRGPNPFLLVTGQAGTQWEAGHFWDWFSRHQLPVMIEPLVKFIQPIVYFFHPGAGFWPKVYFLLVGLWTVVAWAVFGGAITRIAAVQAARGEKIGWTEALRFTGKRLLSYVSAPIFPMLFLFALLVLLVIFGFLVLIPFVGDFVAGFLWVGPLVLGLIMAVVLVGLVGWPLMSATISAEGTDSWEAVSRSYSYVYQKPWHYIWYSLVAICYGAVLVFFVGFMGSLMVYLAKWGVASTPGIEKANRDPSFLFVYAPDSFGWRPLLLQGVTTDQGPVVSGGQINPNAYKAYTDTFHWWNYVAAGLIAFWLGLIFLLILGFGYSYFWSAGTLIYLLMRRNVDAAELDEVYLEEDEHEGPYTPAPAPPPPPASAIKQGGSVTMVESPALRTVPPSASAPAPAPLPAPAPIPAAAPAAPSPVETPPSAEAAPVPAPDGDVSAAPPPTGDGATSDK